MRHDCVTAARAHAAWLLLTGWFWLWLPTGLATADSEDSTQAGFVVREANARLRDGVYLLDANVGFRFSTAVLDALDNGIPLGLEIQIKVERRRAWTWDDTVASLSQRYILQYHALSDRYVVHNLNTGQRQSYTALDEALFMLGQIREFPMLDQRLLESDGDYRASVRAALMIEELPTPMRLWAYASDQWRLDSAWYSWPLHR